MRLRIVFWLGRREFITVQDRVAIAIGGFETVCGSHRPFLKGQQIVAIKIELAEITGADGKHLVARDPPIKIAINPPKAALLAAKLGRLGRGRSALPADVSTGQCAGRRDFLAGKVGRRCAGFSRRAALPPEQPRPDQQQRCNSPQHHAIH